MMKGVPRLFLAGTWMLWSAAGAAERPPNVVIILADDLGINDLGCYGRTDHATPHLDRLARESLRFTSAYCAQPICSPSRAALLAGTTPARLRLTTYLPGRPDAVSQKLLHPAMRQALPLEERTLAELLKPAGYVSACIGKWHLGGAGFGPREQGFDFYFPGRADTEPSDSEGGKGEYELTSEAEKFIAANRHRPFLLYLAHNSPHIPLAARQSLIEKHAAAFNPLYAAVIETLDDATGRLLSAIDREGLREETIVIFTSDNGGLHVLESNFTPATHNGPFRAGKGFLYEGGLRIPLLVRWTGRIKPGICDAPVVNTDWPATLLELAGSPLPAGLDGRSIAGLLTGKEAAAERTLFWHFPHYTNQGGRPAGAVREGNWKLIEHYEDGRLELYRLDDDPGEERDRSLQEPARTAAWREKLAAWRRQVSAQENEPNPRFDPAPAKRLYHDVDVSRLRRAPKADELAEELKAWRREMNAVLRQPSPGK